MKYNGVGKLGIRVWGWPTLVFVLLELFLLLVFKLRAPDKSQYFLEPGSDRALLFDAILGILIVSYLWTLVYRYSKLGERKLSWIIKGGVILITLMALAGWLCAIFLHQIRNLGD